MNLQPILQQISKDYFRQFALCLKFNESKRREACLDSLQLLYATQVDSIMQESFSTAIGTGYSRQGPRLDFRGNIYANRTEMFGHVDDMKKSLVCWNSWAKNNASLLRRYKDCFHNIQTSASFNSCIRGITHDLQGQVSEKYMCKYVKTTSQKQSEDCKKKEEFKSETWRELSQNLQAVFDPRSQELTFAGFLLNQKQTQNLAFIGFHYQKPVKPN